MRVEDLLEKIEELLDNGQKVAFSSKITVDVEVTEGSPSGRTIRSLPKPLPMQ